MEEITPPATSNQQPATSIVQPLSPPQFPKIKIDWDRKTYLAVALIILVGLATGYGLYALNTAGTVRLADKDIEVVKSETEEGVKDASTFRDTATGTLTENDGKITNEGTHILVRGDVSQNAYLTSSVIDLSKYVGKKVQIWGETFKGQKAGWLMDVGRIKVVN
jgi:hypothetical protein